MTSIFEKRLQLTPHEYGWAKEQFEVALQNAWSHTEVPMQADLTHWNSVSITDIDRQAIAGILRGFTVIEEVVGDQWANLAIIFPKPEIISMCRTFSAQECVHAFGYDLLETTIGISEENWEAFQKDKYAQDKLNTYTAALDYISQTPDSVFLSLKEETANALGAKNLNHAKIARKNIAKGIAIFGGCVEGVSLFGSFAILMSYCRGALFPGMNQILSWSVRDEDLHSICAIQLYKEFISEFPDARLNVEVIREAFSTAVELEKSFIAPAFSNGDLSSGLTFKNALNFIKHRANLKMEQLGYDPLYSDTDNDIAEWFYPLTNSTPLHDFFVQRANGGAYAAKIKQDFTNVDLEF